MPKFKALRNNIFIFALWNKVQAHSFRDKYTIKIQTNGFTAKTA